MKWDYFIILKFRLFLFCRRIGLEYEVSRVFFCWMFDWCILVMFGFLLLFFFEEVYGWDGIYGWSFGVFINLGDGGFVIWCCVVVWLFSGWMRGIVVWVVEVYLCKVL